MSHLYLNIKYKEKAQNPFEICHGEECIKNITTYDFKKGESYKIYARIYKYILPAFSFHDIDKKDGDETDQTDQTDQTDSDSTDQTDSDSTDHTDSDTTDGKNYSYYLSLNLLAISILLLSL